MSPATRIAINGFGRMGRLAVRALWPRTDLCLVHINELAGDASQAAHLLQFDSLQGEWGTPVRPDSNALMIADAAVSYSQHQAIGDTDWRGMGVDLVIDCTGAFKTSQALEPYFAAGVKKVVVSAPIPTTSPDTDFINIVMGVNDAEYDASRHRIITAASCTTNCIAPIIDVMHACFGIRHGAITTLHAVTNTQRVLDGFHKDLRRARSSGSSLIPTSTGSARAIADIFPDLRGRLNGIAVRVPTANASLADCVFELQEETTTQAVNDALRTAAAGRLQGVLGVEDRPLVSTDYCGDERSAIVDTLSTQVIDGSQVKVLAWYDNEVGYVQRMIELTQKVAASA